MWDLFLVACGLQVTQASVVMVHGLSCSKARGISGPQPGIKPMSPALQGRFLTTGPPGKSCHSSFLYTALTYSLPNLEPACYSMSGYNCYFLMCIQISLEAGKVVWYSHLFKSFPQFVVIHIVKGFGIVSEAEVDVFLEFPLTRRIFLAK